MEQIVYILLAKTNGFSRVHGAYSERLNAEKEKTKMESIASEQLLTYGLSPHVPIFSIHAEIIK